MRRPIPTATVTTTGALLITMLAVATAPGGHPIAAGADNRGHPTSAKTYFASSQPDPRDYWTPERMAAAKPVDLVRDRGRARVVESDEVGNSPPRIAGVDVPDERSGGAITPAVAQPALNYPFPFGRRYVEKPIRKTAPYRTIGRVFFRHDGLPYVCSGSSVVSAPKHVVFTAGHCLHLDGIWSTDVIFVPGRQPGKKKKRNPFGKFAAKRLWVPTGWRDDQNDAFDMGAFSVGRNGKGRKLQRAVGALGFAYGQERTQHWDIFGYPVGAPFRNNKLTMCSAQWARDDLEDGNDSIGVGCDMKGGSSGGPWILRLKRGNLVNGIITYGYGHEPGAIYGPYFGANANWIRCAAATNDQDAQTC